MEVDAVSEGGRGPWRSRLGEAVAAGAVVFAAFATYAFLAPATYQTHVSVGISPVDKLGALSLAPSEAKRRLREAVLAPEVVQRLAEARLPAESSSAERQAAALQVQKQIDIDSVDARSFIISCSESSALRAQRLCTDLAARAMQLGPRVLLPLAAHEPPPTPSAREPATPHALVPEVRPELPVPSEAVSVAAKSSDPLNSGLHAERNRILAVLEAEALAAAASSDNPYDAGASQVDTTQLKRRLVEIDRTLVARRPSRSIAKGATAEPVPELRREPPADPADVEKARAPQSPTPIRLQATLLASAALPNSPIRPNRSRILLMGAALGLLFGIIVAKARRLPKLETSDEVRGPESNEASSSAAVEPGQNSLDGDESAENPAPAEHEAARDFASTQRSPSEPPKRQSSTSLRKAAVEINVSAARQADPRTDPEGTLPSQKKSPMARTQALGSPMPAIVMPPSATVEAEPGLKEHEMRGHASASRIAVAEAGDAVHPYTSVAPPGLNVVATPAGWVSAPGLSVESRLALRDELYALAGDRRFVVAVTGVSGTSAEKSRVAAELALCLSQPARSRVLLLEANFQRPFVHRLARVEMPTLAGFSEQLKSAELDGQSRPWTVLQCSRSLHVLAEGVMRVPEMILSQEFQRCISELRMRYDFVVIDGPLLSEPSACRAVDRVVDGAVVVHTEAKNVDLERASASFPGKCISSVSATG